MLRLALAVLAAAPLLAPSAEADDERFDSDRPGRTLALPDEDDAFSFVVFGDRTGGPAEGIEVLRQAVHDANLLDPDLVMTVGDLIEGYNTTARWMPQMEEFRAAMDALSMPWFPVAGNHDIYWRGEGRPPEEHEAHYEMHFGPPWDAFDHKGCTFVVLYTDEGNPETGERNFRDPECQRMSDAQLEWLDATLERARDSRHVFVFMHHPRWLDWKYGDDWGRVHERLARAGNVTAVFAGHIHRMRYDGRRDGVEYFTLATVGGHLPSDLPRAGFLHQFHVVTVRDGGIAVATLPVGTVVDPKTITGDVSDQVAALDRDLTARQHEAATLGTAGEIDADVTFTVRNPTARPLDVTLTPRTGDLRFAFSPDHVHPTVPPGESVEQTFRLRRRAAPLDENFQLPELEVAADWLGEGLRVGVPPRTVALRVRSPAFPAPTSVAPDRVLALDGQDDALRVEPDDLALPDGPMTLEGRLWARDLRGRRPFLAQTEGSEFGLFVSDGRASFSVHLDGAYVTARADRRLETERWHHLAGVFDGAEVRLYVDGVLAARAEGSGRRTRNRLPFYVGADPDRLGRPQSFFDGRIDDVRVSAAVRYVGERIEPSARPRPDEATCLLLTMDHARGAWVLDLSERRAHPHRIGGARLVDAAESTPGG